MYFVIVAQNSRYFSRADLMVNRIYAVVAQW